MQTGYRFRCYPTKAQEQILLQWIGCQRFIYNCKVSEDRYFRGYAKKFCSYEYAPVDQQYGHFIGPETPWLQTVPCQILRNGVVRWRQAYQRFFRKIGKPPKIHKAHGRQSVWLTSELFSFVDGVFAVGTKKYPVGIIRFQADRAYAVPSAIYISIDGGRWYVSFKNEDGQPEFNEIEIATQFESFSREELLERTVGLDRGVAIPVAASSGQTFQFRSVEKRRLQRKEKAIKRWQRKLARRQQQSARRSKAKKRVAALKRYGTDLRRDFAHQTSRKLVNDPQTLLYVFEDLKLKNMTKSARGTIKNPGKNVKQKAGLNRALLSSALGQTKTYLTYKARRAHKLSISVPPFRSSQECRICGHIHPDNRISQSEFVCQACGHTENADLNAGGVLRKRGVDLLLSGKWKPKEKKKIKFFKVRQEVPEPKAQAFNAQGESVSHNNLTVAMQFSLNWETQTTAIFAEPERLHPLACQVV